MAVHTHHDLLVGKIGVRRRHLARHREAHGKPGDGGLAVLWEGVVGARRDTRDGNLAAGGDHRAVRAVAAQHHDSSHTLLLHQAGGLQRVVHRAGDLVVEVFDLGEMRLALVLRTVDAAAHVMPDAAILRHHPHMVDAAGLHAGQNAQHDVGTIGDLQRGRIRNHPPYVTRGDWIGDDADGDSHALPSFLKMFLEGNLQ